MNARWRLYIGVVLLALPLAILVIGYFTMVTMVATGQEAKIRSPERVFQSRIDAKMVGDEFFLKSRKSEDFQKVNEHSFNLAIERENQIIRQSHAHKTNQFITYLGVVLSWIVGLFLIKSSGNEMFKLPPISLPSKKGWGT